MPEIEFAVLIFWFTSLFSIVNPISAAIISLGFMKNYTHQERKEVAKRAAIIASVVLIIFSLAGNAVFRFFSVSLEALYIGGGICICLIGFRMLNPHEFHKRLHPEVHAEALKKDDVSVMPLAVPLLSGPGAIATTILISSKITTTTERALLGMVIVVLGILIYLCIGNADRIDKFLGKTGAKTVEKIMGIIIVTIGIQFILNGITKYAFLTFGI
ncbi:NAAT family transporter [Candidatus Woesearchaeota archaeon]|nr:NAAT family transporter [Candidatus Woesearchaeota archaeon]